MKVADKGCQGHFLAWRTPWRISIYTTFVPIQQPQFIIFYQSNTRNWFSMSERRKRKYFSTPPPVVQPPTTPEEGLRRVYNIFNSLADDNKTRAINSTIESYLARLWDCRNRKGKMTKYWVTLSDSAHSTPRFIYIQDLNIKSTASCDYSDAEFVNFHWLPAILWGFKCWPHFRVCGIAYLPRSSTHQRYVQLAFRILREINITT